MTWRMPAETARQDRVWMAFPQADLYSADDTEQARRAWSLVANTILDFEPVTMVVDPADREVARRYLSAGVELVSAPLDDAWARDIGPSFVLDEQGNLGAVEWTFNGWGQQVWSTWEKDREIGRFISQQAGASSIPSQLVNEGGGLHVDGLGTVLLTDTVQLDPLRNPGLTKAAVEAELARTIGTTHAVWVPRGLTRDAGRYGTRGHIDMVATIPAPGQLLVHVQPDPTHPDFEVTRQALQILRESHDARGVAWEITEVPAPKTLRDEEGWVDWNYINHLVVNGAVIACGYEDPQDAPARELLAQAYPGREIRMLDARAILARGGGIHCITQQQPSTTA
jgi:agmatine deiminase